MIDNSGPAFPCTPPLSGGVSASGYPYPASGMTLRDYFAAKALAALIIAPLAEWPDDVPAPYISRVAYELADAMLAARSAS